MDTETILTIYESHFKLAAEEMPDSGTAKWHSLATEWTMDDVANKVAKVCEVHYWERQDKINKEFFS